MMTINLALFFVHKDQNPLREVSVLFSTIRRIADYMKFILTKTAKAKAAHLCIALKL